MKKIYILLIAFALPLFSSCDGMLEEKIYGSPTVEDMMANPENVGLLVGQIYADLKWVHDHWGYWGVSTLTTDEGACPTRYPGEDWADGNYWVNLNTHNWNPRGEAFQNIWSNTISAAVLCNKLIETLNTYKENIDEEAYGQYMGELETMRSYYYYLIFDCFGRIPYLETFSNASGAPLLEAPVVWSRLVASLERNAPNMVVVSDANRAANYGRVTQGFAYALLARLYLNAESFGCTPDNIDLSGEFYDSLKEKFGEKEGYEEPTKIVSSKDFYTNAIRCCDAVIGAKSYSVESNFFSNFKIQNENSKENIFVIVENGLADFDERSNGKMSNKLRIIALTMHYAHQTPWKMIEKPWNGFCARSSFMDLYKGDDTNGYDVRGAGPALPADIPTPPPVMEEKDFDESDIKSEYDDYEDYQTQALADYHALLNEGTDCYAVRAKDYGTNMKQQYGWFIGPVFDEKGTKIVIDDKKFGAVIVPEMTLRATNASDADEINNRCEGARLYKYEVDKMGANKWAENDFVLMRYADVLWMKAEAALREGASAIPADLLASSDFQTMLSRAFDYSGKAASFESVYKLSTWTLDNILEERGREFAWELTRRRDLIRFGKFADVEFVTATDKYREWFPIPYSELKKSGGFWKQNDGYTE